MRKVVRAYAKGQDGNPILIGTISIPHSKDKRSPRERQEKNIWSDKEQRSSREKILLKRPSNDQFLRDIMP